MMAFAARSPLRNREAHDYIEHFVGSRGHDEAHTLEAGPLIYAAPASGRYVRGEVGGVQTKRKGI